MGSSARADDPARSRASRLRRPAGAGAVACGAAALAWAGAAAGSRSGVLAGTAAVAAGAAARLARRRYWPAVAVLVAAAGLSGALAAGRERDALAAAVPTGRVVVAGVAADDAVALGGAERFTLLPSHLESGGAWLPWEGPRLAVTGPPAGMAAGERVLVAGTLRKASFLSGSGPMAGEVEARVVERLGPASDPLFATGNLLRRRVLGGAAAFGSRPAAALLAGFLIGDESGLGDADREALRLSGLSHFVAVSGSNVALFLTAWWLASGPLGWGPRRRAVLGLIGLAVFVVATRWEPSVVRAAAMAALVLGGRLAGRAVDGWAALGARSRCCSCGRGTWPGTPGSSCRWRRRPECWRAAAGGGSAARAGRGPPWGPRCRRRPRWRRSSWSTSERCRCSPRSPMWWRLRWWSGPRRRVG